MDGRPTWTDCDEAGDYVVPNVLSPRDLVFRPDNMDETVPHTIFQRSPWPVKAKLYVELLWVGRTKAGSQHLGHMTKMATYPLYGKNPSKIFFSEPVD